MPIEKHQQAVHANYGCQASGGSIETRIYDDLIFRQIGDNGDGITGHDINCEPFALEARIWRRVYAC
jgi:hypothetical protein